MGSIPVRVTKKKTTSYEVVFLFVSPQGIEELNATVRGTVAPEGLTEGNLD